MSEQLDNETLAAITMALYEYEGYNSHDEESGTLTMQSNATMWNTPLAIQRELPEHRF